ncbi:LPD38 domain-containing protein [Prevotella melaninogenica]|uniref:LPD38 domain-containing protein n=1 Tax=Prevotella melaninogenica TaxID=28132 RepID=UPI002150E45C|nr:LPD38 domain-containing protein [Prevotella melaninogenica]
MPNKVTYTITTSDGKEHQVSKENIDKYGIQSYADAYKGATIRMRDAQKGDYDIPLQHFDNARKQGLHAFSLEHTPVQKQAAPKPTPTPTAKPTPSPSVHPRQSTPQVSKPLLSDSFGKGTGTDFLKPKPVGYNLSEEHRNEVLGEQAKRNATPSNPHVQRAIQLGNEAKAKRVEREQKRFGKPTIAKAFDDAAVHGDKKAAKELGMPQVMQQKKDEIDYMQATGKELRNPVDAGLTYDENGDVVHSMFAPTVARDERGNIVTNEAGEPLVGISSDEARAKAYGDSVQTGIEAQREKNKVDNLYKDAVESVNDAFDEDYKKKEAFRKEHPFLGAVSDALEGFSNRGNALQYTPEGAKPGLAALGMLSKAAIAKNNADRYGDAGTLSRLYGGIMAGLTDVDTYDFGITDTFNAANLYRAAKNYEEGKATAKDKMLLDAAAIANNVQSEASDKLGGAFGAGQNLVGTIGFMAQMATNPASGVGKEAAASVAKTVAKRALQRFGKGAIAKAVTGLAKGAARVGMDAVEAGVVTGMYSPTKIVGDYLNRKTGDVQSDGKGGYIFQNKEYSNVKALAKAINGQYAENISEMWGEYLPGVGKVNAAIGRGARKIGLGKVVDAFEHMSSSNWAKTWKNFQERTKWNGMAGEYFEEVANNLYNAVTNGDMTLDTDPHTGVFNPKINLDTFYSVALMSGIMSGVNTAGYARERYKAPHEQRKADAQARSVFGERWDEYKNAIDNADEKQIGSVMEKIGSDKSLSSAQKIAALQYQYRTAVVHGVNAQDTKNKLEGQFNAMDEAYSMGYNLQDEKELNNTAILYDEAKKQATKATGWGEDTLESMIGEDGGASTLAYMKHSDEFNDGQLQSFTDYANARAAYNGMIQRVKDDIDTKVHESELVVDQRTNLDTGAIHPATMKVDNRQVYIVNGNVVMLPDGSGVDHEHSDDFVVLRDAETGELETADPSAIFKVDAPINVQEEKEAVADNIRQTFAQQQADKIDGKLEFKQGDTYSIIDKEDGTQHSLSIIGDAIDEKTGQVNPEMVLVDIDGAQQPILLPKEQVQQQVDEARRAAVAATQVVENAPTTNTNNTYSINDEVTLSDENGNTVRGSITAPENEDGKFEVYTEQPINGKKVNLFSAEELDAITKAPETVAENATVQQPQQQEETEESVEKETPKQQPTALERIPKDESGQPLYEQTEPETAWDAIVEQTEGDTSMAQTVVDDMVSDLEAGVKKAEKTKAKSGGSIAEKIAAEKERAAVIEQAKATLAHWRKIAAVNRMREAAIQAEEQRKADEVARVRKEQEEKERVEQEEAERIKREALNGVPDFVEDKATDARARGYRRVNGDKVDRQEPINATKGKEVQVKFDDDNIPTGHVAIIEANQLQPSHKNGQRNPQHFIDEAQPKERKDDASVGAARKIAANIRPEEITSSVTAYTGAPTVNSRGEVIQGNNRSAALREMWDNHQEQGDKYKQYLIDHAESFGLRPEDITAMDKPVLVNMLDVNDDEAISLGQFVASDTESGGTERIKPKNVVKKLGDKMKNFANILLRANDENVSFAELVDSNGVDALKWLNANGVISPTQYKSAFDSKGNITAEAKNDIKGIMYQSIFEGGNTQLEEMFNALPAKAQKAILATAYRDYDSPQSERMIVDIQDSIMAYYALSHDSMFMNAKNHKEARIAVEAWRRQLAFDDVTGESYLPAEKYSNFALLLATMYKGDNQSLIQGTFNKMYDLIQGTQEETLFEQPDNTPRSLAQAIKETLNIEYNGQQGSNVLAGDNSASQEGRTGSNGDATSRGRSENSDGTETNQGGTERDSGRNGEKRVETSDEGAYSLSQQKSDNGENFYQDINGNIDLANIPDEVFNKINKPQAPFRLTPSMLKHVFDRNGKEMGLSKADDAIDFVLDVIDNFDHVRQGEKGAIIFSIENGRSRTGRRAVTVLLDSLSGSYYGIKTSGYERIEGLAKRTLLWEKGAKDTSATGVAPANVSTEQASQSNEQAGSASNHNNDFEGKDKQSSDTKQEIVDNYLEKPTRDADLFAMAERVAEEDKAKRTRKKEEAKVDTNPTEAQKEAGNYKKGHIKVDGFNVTIEQPKGSVRRGKDANGKEWETEMHNTYGYIRGTESVDGDHIDIFLSDNPTEGNVFVVDQVNKDGSFDEHKVMYGFSDMESARKAYLSNYEEGWQGLGNITEVSKEEFKKWIDSSKRKTKPFAEYSSVKTEGDVNVQHPIENKGSKRLVSNERYEELKKRMRSKLGQLNLGVDPEMLAIGAEMAVYHIENGARAFGAYAKEMISDLGDAIRPYLKAFYNGARDLPEMTELSSEMTPYDEVSRFDVATIGNEGEQLTPSAIETAEQINNEATVEFNAKQEQNNTNELEDVDNDAYSITKQHNNKKDVDIWVVRGKERTDKDVYTQRKQVAKEYNGYYSSFRGVNGFVFNSAEEAHAFADAIFNTQSEENRAQNSEEDIVSKEKTTDHKEVEKTIEHSTNSRLLAQYNALKEKYPDTKILLRVGDFYETYQDDAKDLSKTLGLVLTKRNDGINVVGFPDYSLDNYLPKLIRAGYRVAINDQLEMPKAKEEVAPKGTPQPKKVNVESLVRELQDGGKARLREHTKEEKVTTQKEKPAKKNNSKKKDVSLEQPTTGDLFGGFFDENESKSQNNEDNPRTRTESRKGNDEVSQRESSISRSVNERQLDTNTEERGSERQGDSRVQSGNAEERSSTERPSGRLSRLNVSNNHAERGVDYAPATVDARIEANIKAIELANELVESGEKATPEQMSVLRRFSGWGGLGKAFNQASYSWSKYSIPARLQTLLGAESYEQAVMSANSAYYTPAYVIDTLWDVAKQMGFKGGNILEGSAGIGNILGLMPMDISDSSRIQAVEIDGTSGNILSLLYPEANVKIQGFEQTRVPNGSVDLAITNVPFVTGLRVNDTTGDGDLSKKFHNIHDFCIAKNVRKLREGGIGIFISSNGTLDSSQKLRDWLVSDGNADVVGAFRLNNKTFGGTGVTSDIIVIRKRVNGQVSPNAIDVSTITGERSVEFDTGETKRVKGVDVPVVKHLSMDYNKYFIEHPEMMAGKMEFAFEHGDKYRATSKGLYPTNDKAQDKLLADFVQSFTNMKDEAASTKQDVEPINVYEELGNDVKEGSMLVNKDGQLCVAQLGQAVPLNLNMNKVKGHTKEECFKAYTEIKQALNDVLKYQTENEGNEGLQPLLDKLNKAYDSFVDTYGRLNKNTSIAFLRNDVDYPNVFSLEKYEEKADKNGNRVESFHKTDIFKKRVVEKSVEPQPKNVKDGIVVSVYKFGKIDIPYISNQLGKTEEDVKREIIASGLGFENPVSKQVEVSYQYLSGNVREKLKQAEENNEGGEYNTNIKALKEVVPNSIPAHLIEFNLGSSWIAPELYEEYVKDKTDVDVKFTAAGGTWFMKEPHWTDNEKNRSFGVHSDLLGKHVMGHELIEAAIQNKTITVSTTRKHYDGTSETITDKEATQACSSRIDEIRQEFKDWARNKMQSNPEMSDKIEQVYNDLFNNYVPIDIPSEYIPEHFGGATHNITLRPHQAKAVVRGTMQPLMLAHEVGTGKTFTLISTAMEMRRLGTARKPMIVVQNATVGQFVASAKELYPNAKILTLEDSDRNAEGRKNFYAKIRYNDWDMIVVPQSTFEFIPDSEERQMTFIQDKIEEKLTVLAKMKDADKSGRNLITRQAEKEVEQLKEELADLTTTLSEKRTAKDEKKRAVTKQNTEVKAREMLERRTDETENFDDMGIDALLIDEAHEYKHLGFATAMQRGVKGVDPSYSKKSQGVFLKTQAVLQKSHGRNVIFATGTPISNTAAEIWTFMRYLMPSETMKEYGIYYFDDFVRNFGNIQQMLEFTTSGKFKENNRFAGYIDLPELVRIWSSVSDTVRTKDAGEVSDKIPEMEGDKAQDLYLPQTPALRGIMKYVKAELEAYDKMSGKEKKENSHIPLTMYSIAKAAAVDARLVDETAEDDPNSKTNEAVRQTLRSLKETASYNGTVALFADNYQNKTSGFNLYEDVKDKLIAAGIPEKQIVVMKSGMTVKKKLEIFDKVNRGEVRVIMGSTFTLGTGVNIQERLHTLIHIDAPNRPMDYTQRNGRILRQGNIHKDMNKPVRVLRFGVEDSLDVTAYQRLKTKGAIAESIMNGKQLMANSMENRILEEEEDSFGDTVAQLSGSEYAMLKNQAEKNVRKYESRKRQWEADQTYIHNAKPRLNGLIKKAQLQKEEDEKNLSLVNNTYPDGKFKAIIVGKHKYDSVAGMEDFFKEHNKKVKEESEKVKNGTNATYGSTINIDVDGLTFAIHTEVSKEMSSQGINLFAKSTRTMTYSQKELGLEDVPVKGALMRNAIEDITDNIITGNDFKESIERATQNIAHYSSDLEHILSREGKPFEFESELEEVKAKFVEYTEAMKKEMEEKEKKYAEMDKHVEAVSSLSEVSEDEETLMRSGQGSFSDNELSFINDPVAKMLGKSNRSEEDNKAFVERERQRMISRISELADKLHLNNIETVTNSNSLQGKKAKAKGFYSKSSGKITIVIPNHASVEDVEKTLLHEAVAHYGLRKLFGEHFETFLDNVYQNVEPEIRRIITSQAANNNWDFRTATEEYLAGLAERTDFERVHYAIWNKIKSLFLKMLHSIGFEGWSATELSDNELRYLLWRSYENMKEPGRYRSILGEAEDVVKQNELKVGNYDQQDTNSSNVAERGILYREDDSKEKERVNAREQYEQRVNKAMFQTQEALQDSMLGLKEAMNAITKAEGKNVNIEDIDGYENAYLGENRLSSVNKAEADAFAHLLFKPMLAEVSKICKNAQERSELVDYMMAKHGLERNAIMRKRAIEDILNNEKLSDAQKSARAGLAEYRDYAGLTALTGKDNVTEAEVDAETMVSEYESTHDTTNLWDKVNAVNAAILSKSYECGMMDKDTYEKISDMYKYYIPLRGFDETTSEEAYAYLLHQSSAFNAPIKVAKGRSSKADDPFANMQSMAESAITQGNRNKLVKQRFFNFVLNHPSDLVSISDMWLKYDDVADEWKPVFPDNFEENDSAEDIEQKLNEFEDKMKKLAEQAPDKYKHGKETTNIPYRVVDSRDLRQHQVLVKRGGRDYILTLNGNPRAAQALNGQTNPDNDTSGAIGAILKAGEMVNRQLSAFYTTRNPDFVVSNFIRDMLFSNSIVWVKESPNYALRFHRNIARCNPAQIKVLLAKHRKGTLDMNNKLEHMFYQFMMNGGETGYANVRDIEQHKNDIRRELKRTNGKLSITKAFNLLGEKLDEYNRAVENCARFAAYLTSREMGRTVERSIYDAKEISVNFNKKGSGAKFMNAVGQTKIGTASAFVSGIGRSGFVFWNAAIQGTTNFGRQFKKHPAKAFTASAIMFLLGAVIAGIGMGDGDDDADADSYWNLPEYVRRSNILFKIGDQWVSIPLPVEYRAIYGMGELMVSAMSGKEHFTGSELGKAIAGQATQVLPIDFLEGGGGVKAFVPSAVKPFAEVYSNKGWTGMPIYKDTPYNKYMPEWTKAYKSANKYLVGIAKTLNESTGGDAYTKGSVDINPAQIEYLLNGYFGGVSGTIDKLSKSAETIAGDREYDPRNFLLLNRILKNGDERTEARAINNEYMRVKEEHDVLKARMKHYENDTDKGLFDYADKIDFLYNSPEFARYEIFEDYSKDIDALYQELKEANDGAEHLSIEKELTELKKEMIEEMNKTRK